MTAGLLSIELRLQQRHEGRKSATRRIGATMVASIDTTLLAKRCPNKYSRIYALISSSLPPPTDTRTMVDKRFASIVSLLSLLSYMSMVVVAEPPMSASQCPTKPIQCCEAIRPSDDPVVKAILALLGIVITGAVVPVGITCTPINVC